MVQKATDLAGPVAGGIFMGPVGALAGGVAQDAISDRNVGLTSRSVVAGALLGGGALLLGSQSNPFGASDATRRRGFK